MRRFTFERRPWPALQNHRWQLAVGAAATSRGISPSPPLIVKECIFFDHILKAGLKRIISHERTIILRPRPSAAIIDAGGDVWRRACQRAMTMAIYDLFLT